MNYPSIRQYTETIKWAANSPEECFDKLSNLRPVLGADGEPIMSSGNFAVVFKMQDTKTGKYYALKCFHREQVERSSYYKFISDELNKKYSVLEFNQNETTTYLVRAQYYEKEMYVDMGNTNSLFPVLLMEWVDGITLDRFILQNRNNQKSLQSLTYRFSRMAKWILSQNFAHGDLKPDNILVRKDGSLVLVDYDGMYVPAMKGKKAIELGSPNFRHPQRTEKDFDEYIDDFSIVSILLSLKAISLAPTLFIQFVTGDKLLFEEKDYQTINESEIMPLLIKIIYNKQLTNLLGAFLIILSSRYFPKDISVIVNNQESSDVHTTSYSEFESKKKLLYFYKNITFNLSQIVYLLPDLFHNGLREYWLPQNMWERCKMESIWWNDDIYKSIYRYGVEFDAIRYSVVGEFSKKSRPFFCNMYDNSYKINYNYLVDYTYGILSEMGVSDFFVENVERLIEQVNNKKDYNQIDYLPF